MHALAGSSFCAARERRRVTVMIDPAETLLVAAYAMACLNLILIGALALAKT